MTTLMLCALWGFSLWVVGTEIILLLLNDKGIFSLCSFWVGVGWFFILGLFPHTHVLISTQLEDLKETSSKSLVFTLCSSLISSILPWEVQLLWPPRSVFSTQEDPEALSGLFFLVLWSENHLQAVSWGDYRALLV